MNMPTAAPPGALPDVRLELERIKNQKAQEENKTGSVLTEDRLASPTPSSSTSAPVSGFPVIDLTQPPPGYPPVQWHYPQPGYDQRYEQDYDAKVRRFLQETGVTEPEKENHNSRSRTRSRHRRSRSRDRSRHRDRSRDRDSSKKKKKDRRNSRSKSSDKKTRRSRDKILLDDDDFARKLNDHLSGSGGDRKKSRSRSRDKSRRSRRSRSRSRNKSGDQKRIPKRSRSKSSKRKEESKEKEASKTGGWQPVGQSQEDGTWTTEDTESRRKSTSAKPMANVFGSEEEQDEKKRKVPTVKKVPASGGMWIPTGEDSILDGVKEAISKLEEKQRYGGRGGSSRDKWDPDRKIRMTEEAPPPSKEYDVTFDSRTGMYIRVPKQLTMAEKIASSKLTQMDREKAKDKDVQQVEERIVRNLSSSPPRLPTKRRSLSKERKADRSRSRDRRRSGRSRSRSRRHRSRSRRHRSRSRKRSRSRDRRSRSKSKDHRRRSRSKSRSRSRHRSKKERTSFDKTNTIQQEISGMREETRRLQSEREAIEREKALLLAGPSGGVSTGQTRPR